MRELTVRIRFTTPCLGDQRCPAENGRFRLPRTPDGYVAFNPRWHAANLRLAAELLGRHQRDVGTILWDWKVDGHVRDDCWHKRYPKGMKGKRWRYVWHEAFLPDDTIGLNCVVPDSISDDDLWQLMTYAGKYRGLSPYGAGEFGRFEVLTILPRRPGSNGKATEKKLEEHGVKAEQPPGANLAAAQ